MPNRDGTGPRGMGPRTGRGLGNCGKTNYSNVNLTKNEQIKILENQKKEIEQKLKELQ